MKQRDIDYKYWRATFASMPLPIIYVNSLCDEVTTTKVMFLLHVGMKWMIYEVVILKHVHQVVLPSHKE